MGFGVFCLILDHGSCLSETRRPLAARAGHICMCVRASVCVCANLRAFHCICVFSHARVAVCVFVAGGLVCWQVVCQEGDSGAFETDTRSESRRGGGGEKKASFMWLCIPPRHRQAEAQDKTCVPPVPPVAPSASTSAAPAPPPPLLCPASTTPPYCRWP